MISGLTNGFVIDASTTIELLVDGKFVKQASRLLDFYVRENPPALTCAHCPAEVVNGLRKSVFREEISIATAEAAIDMFPKLGLRLEAPVPYMSRSWQFRDVMSAYDASYAATAEVHVLPLVTTDRRLARACAVADIEAITLDQI